MNYSRSLDLRFTRTEPDYDMWGNLRRSGAVEFEDGVVYRDRELELVRDLKPRDARFVHRVKKLFVGEIQCPNVRQKAVKEIPRSF